MAGLIYSLAVNGLDVAEKNLAGLAAYDLAESAFAIGELLVNSTKERIDTGKKSPDGEPWAPWSEAYAATRGAQHSLLVGEGDLMDSITNYSSSDEISVGTNLVYGARRQFGGAQFGAADPGRAYLGLSEEDAREIRELVLGDIEGAMQ